VNVLCFPTVVSQFCLYLACVSYSDSNHERVLPGGYPDHSRSVRELKLHPNTADESEIFQRLQSANIDLLQDSGVRSQHHNVTAQLTT